MQSKIPAIIAGVIIVSGAAFYGGTKYAAAKAPAAGNMRVGQGQMQGQGGPGGSAARGNMMRGGANGGFTGGEVLSKDDKSLTIKLPDGGSKIVLFGSTVEVMKSVSGSLADVAVGSQVTVTGSADAATGTVTAKSIQIRPAGTVMPGMGMGGRGAAGEKMPAPVPAQ